MGWTPQRCEYMTCNADNRRAAHWFARMQNAIVDWGYRAVHLSVLAGKEVVKQYYQTPANKSYYLGCSNGEWAHHGRSPRCS